MIGNFDELAADEPYPGLQRRAFDSAGATVTEYRFEPAARFPVHRHAQEQITLIVEGEVEMAIDAETSHLRAGDWSVVGPQVPHGITAGPEGARVLAIVVPRRAGADAITVVE